MLANGRRHIPVLATGTGTSSTGDLVAATGVPLANVTTLISLRELLAYLVDCEVKNAHAAGLTEEALQTGIPLASSSATAPADATVGSDAAQAAASSGADASSVVPPTSAPTAASASSPAAAPASATTPAPAVPAGTVTLRHRVDALLGDMTQRGRRILLNTRLDDNISTADAANVMADRGMSCVAVVDDAGALQGVFTGRDFIKKIASASGQDATVVRVRDVMSAGCYVTTTDRSVLKVARSMLKRGIRHLPIVDEGDHRHVVGIVSLADVARPFVTTYYTQPEGAATSAASVAASGTSNAGKEGAAAGTGTGAASTKLA